MIPAGQHSQRGNGADRAITRCTYCHTETSGGSQGDHEDNGVIVTLDDDVLQRNRKPGRGVPLCGLWGFCGRRRAGGAGADGGAQTSG